jgi:hypothetical protein
MKWHIRFARAKPNVILLDFSHQSKTMIYTFNIQGTAMPGIASVLQGTDEKSFDQILKQFIPEY